MTISKRLFKRQDRDAVTQPADESVGTVSHYKTHWLARLTYFPACFVFREEEASLGIVLPCKRKIVGIVQPQCLFCFGASCADPFVGHSTLEASIHFGIDAIHSPREGLAAPRQGCLCRAHKCL